MSNRQLEVYFFLKKYTNKNGLTKNLVAAISRNLKDYGEFEKESRHINQHKFFEKEFSSCKFKNYRNHKIVLKGLQIDLYYDQSTDWFKFNGRPLRKVSVNNSADYSMYDSVIELPDSDTEQVNEIRSISALNPPVQLNQQIPIQQLTTTNIQNQNHSSFLSNLSAIQRDPTREYIRDLNQRDVPSNQFNFTNVSRVIMKMRNNLRNFNIIDDDFMMFVPKFKNEFIQAGGDSVNAKDVLMEFLDEIGINFVLRTKRNERENNIEIPFDELVKKLNTLYSRVKVYKIKECNELVYKDGRLETFVISKLKHLRFLYPYEKNLFIIRMVIASMNHVDLINKFCESVSENLELFLKEIKIYDLNIFGQQNNQNDLFDFQYDLNDYFPRNEQNRNSQMRIPRNEEIDNHRNEEEMMNRRVEEEMMNGRNLQRNQMRDACTNTSRIRHLADDTFNRNSSIISSTHLHNNDAQILASNANQNINGRIEFNANQNNNDANSNDNNANQNDALFNKRGAVGFTIPL